MNRILIYAFRPFDHYKRNSAEDLVMNVNVKEIKKVILDPDYDMSKLYDVIKNYKPEVVIGFGKS